MLNLSVTIATNVAQTLAQLEEVGKRLLDEAETLSAMQRGLEFIQRERDAAYGFT